MKSWSPDKFMDVTSVKVSDEDGFLSRSMMIKAKNIIMKERIWISVKLTIQNRVAKVDVEPNATSWTHSRSSNVQEVGLEWTCCAPKRQARTHRTS